MLLLADIFVVRGWMVVKFSLGLFCCACYMQFACSPHPPHGFFFSFPQPKDMHLEDRRMRDLKQNQSINLPTYIHICLFVCPSFSASVIRQ